MRARGWALFGLLGLTACAGAQPPTPVPALQPPISAPAAPAGLPVAPAPNASACTGAGCATADDPRHRQYFDKRHRRYYYFDPARKMYFWQNGELKR